MFEYNNMLLPWDECGGKRKIIIMFFDDNIRKGNVYINNGKIVLYEESYCAFVTNSVASKINNGHTFIKIHFLQYWFMISEEVVVDLKIT